MRKWSKLAPTSQAFLHISYAHLDQLISSTEKQLKQLTNSLLAFTAVPSIETIVLILAAWRLGKGIYPLNPKLPYEAICPRIALTQATWIDPHSLRPILPPPPIKPSENRLATLIETSSSKKIVCHQFSQLIVAAESATLALDVKPQDRYCLSLPLFHVSGIAILLRTFSSGATLLFPQEIELATHLSMVPTQLLRIFEEKKNFPHLKCLLMGGAPLPSHLYERALSSQLPLYLSYGMTETASMALCKPPHRPTQLLPHIECRLANDGEMLFRGTSLFSHYFGEPERSYSDWFATKDVGKIGSDGEIEIVGRKDRQFISGGENIQPEEIEAHLLTIDSVLDAKVSPRSDPTYGMRPIAVVYADRPIRPEAIKEALMKVLPRYKIPDWIEVQTVPLFDAKRSLLEPS